MKLLFVLTFKGSLEKWTREGIANREMEVCFEYLRQNMFSNIQVYSYSRNDQKFLQLLNFEPELKERIELIMPDKDLKTLWDYFLYSISANKIRRVVRGASVCKTNQINGCWTALIARLYGCPMFLRCGYILSRRLFKNKQFIKGSISLIIELICFNSAKIISVTTSDAKNYVSRLVLGQKSKIFVAPTYVNTNIFNAKITDKKKNNEVIFVGRLEPQKNIMAMIDACALAEVHLTIVGSGSLEAEMLARAKQKSLPFKHYKSLTNEEIANLLKSFRYFLLPSLHEGLPKVLIEAMSSEMVCVGTPTSGINTLIIPHETGYLASDFSAEAIANSLRSAINDTENSEKMAQNARLYVLKNHSIKTYVEREYSMIKGQIC